MSFMQRKANYAYGITNFLMKKGVFEDYPSKRKLNKFMVKYLKDEGLPYVKWNNRYKGINTADLVNSVRIQNDFRRFRKFVDKEIAGSSNGQLTSLISWSPHKGLQVRLLPLRQNDIKRVLRNPNLLLIISRGVF